MSGGAKSAARKQPVRSCMVCRQRAEKAALLRIVWAGRPVWDRRQRLPGRGGYVHAAAACVAGLGEKRRWERALGARAAGIESEDVAVLQLEIKAAYGLVEQSAAPRGRKDLGGLGKVRL